jgi:hypothetical protein
LQRGAGGRSDDSVVVVVCVVRGGRFCLVLAPAASSSLSSFMSESCGIGNTDMRVKCSVWRRGCVWTGSDGNATGSGTGACATMAADADDGFAARVERIPV